jgi:SPP1 gp7 family putative phage head morphogenesis protein
MPRTRASLREMASAPQPTRTVSIDLLQQAMFSTKPPESELSRFTWGSALSLEAIAFAIRDAEMGNLKPLADLSRETINTDPHLSAVLNKRFNAIGALPYDVIPASGEGIDKERAFFYAEVVRQQLAALPRFHERIVQVAWGLFDGRAAQELVWTMATGPSNPKFGAQRWAVTDLQWIHPRRLILGPERELRVYDGYDSYAFRAAGVALRDVAYKFLEFKPQRFGDYPEREGLALRCLYWSFMKRFAARERMILVELFAKPIRVVEVDAESTASDLDLRDAENKAELLGAHHSIRMPRGTKLNVIQLEADGAAHSTVISECDKQMSKLVLGQTGTTDGSPAGGLGAGLEASIMKDEQMMILLSDSRSIAEAIEDHLTDAIIAVNFGPDATSHAPYFRLRSDLPADRSKELDRLDKTLKAGVPVALTEVYEISGFRKPAEDEAIVRVDQPDTPPMAVQAPPPRPVVIFPLGQVPPPGFVQPNARVGVPGAPSGTTQPPVADLRPGGNPNSGPALPEGGAPGADPLPPGQSQQPMLPGIVPPPQLPAPAAAAPAAEPLAANIAGIELGVGTLEKIMTVNEARSATGLGDLMLPNGVKDPDGDLTITEFEAKRSALGAGLGEGAAKEVFPPPAPPSPAAPGAPAAPGDEAPAAEPEEDGGGALKRAVEGDGAVVIAMSREVFKKLVDARLDQEAAQRCVHALEHVPPRDYYVQQHGEQVCFAKQPGTVYGSPETLIDKGAVETSRLLGKWIDRFAAAVGGKTTAREIYRALVNEQDKIDGDLNLLARPIERRVAHSLMLGALDSNYEVGNNVTIAPVKFARENEQAAFAYVGEDGQLAGALLAVTGQSDFVNKSYAEAVKYFKAKNAVTRAAFEQMLGASKRRAFSVARAANQQMLRVFQAELARQVSDGADLRDFKQALVKRAELAGFTPANKSHVETIFRTNVLEAYNAGRAKHMTQPHVLKARPFWKIVGVGDSRARGTHKAVHGWVLKASDPVWSSLSYPAGFNCRCRLVSVAKDYSGTVRAGTEIKDLPDPGFETGGVSELVTF